MECAGSDLMATDVMILSEQGGMLRTQLLSLMMLGVFFWKHVLSFSFVSE